MNDEGGKRITIGRTISWTVAIALILAGLAVVGYFVLISVAMASFGSNK